MSQPDLAHARSYVMGRLEQELPAEYAYHNLRHTAQDVLPAAERLAEMEGVQGEDLLLLQTAVLFHDLGFVETYANHEDLGIQIAREVLPQFGYSAAQIQLIEGIIQTTRLPQSPHTLLERIMADADLDVIGRDNFLEYNQNLRDEYRTQGRVYSDREWYASQLKFIRDHSYFTASAHQLRDAQKARNIAEMEQLLTQAQAEAQARAAKAPVLDINERVALLRTVSLFSEIPDEILAELAALLTPVEMTPKQVLFNKGDLGDSMYIIVRGWILIHDGEMEVNRLGPADVFGEMAIVDDQPRLASATALDNTQLLRLSQDTFYELMDHRSEFARGVIRVLNRRLRSRVRDMAEDFLYIQQVGKITAAAAALEAGLYESATLDAVGKRPDELGQLARVFQRMANEVRAREQRLKQEVQELRIQIDEVKKAQQVAEITESEYFQQLQSKIQRIKKR
ncbi:MAG: cyclic nucleotide-binding domain-containing protein [Chloroflexota bacterium]